MTFFNLESGEQTGEFAFGDSLVSRPLVTPDGSRMVTESRASRPPGGPRLVQFHPVLITRVLNLSAMRVLGTRFDANTAIDASTARFPVRHAPSGLSLLRLTDFKLRLIDLRTVEDVREIDLEHKLASARDDAEVLIFSPAGDRFAAKLHDHRFAVYATLTGKRVCLSGRQTEPFDSIRFSPEGQRLVTTRGGEARVWDAATGLPITGPLRHAMFAGQARFTPDGRNLLCLDDSLAVNGQRRAFLRVWDVGDRRAVYEPEDLPLLESAPVLAREGRQLAVATETGEIHLIDVRTRETTRRLLVEGERLRQAQLHPRSGHVAALGDRKLFVWDEVSDRPRFVLPHEEDLTGLRFDPEGTGLAAAERNGHVRVWDPRTGKARTPSLQAGEAVRQLRFSADGGRLLVATGTNLCTWNLSDPDQTGQRFSVSDAEIDAEGRQVLSRTTSGIRVREAATGREIVFLSHEGSLESARFSPDGRHVIVAGPAAGEGKGLGGFVVVWDLSTGRRSLDLQCDQRVRDAIISPDGGFIVTHEADHSLRFRLAASGLTLGEPRHLPDRIDGFSVLPDGLAAVSGGRLWLFPLPPRGKETPDWLPRLADAVARRTLDSRDEITVLTDAAGDTLRRSLADREGDDAFSRFARWFGRNDTARTLAPESSQAWDLLLERLLKRDDEESLRRALLLAPDDPRAWRQLAEILKPEAPVDAAAWRTFSESYRRGADR